MGDGCAAHDGTPLQIYLQQQYGLRFFFAFFCCSLWVTVGIFNLIMATFDSVLSQCTKRRLMHLGENGESMQIEILRVFSYLFERDVSHDSEFPAEMAGWM